MLNFECRFEALTGHPPFPWQRTLFDRICANELPRNCVLPTGLGKTSILAIWLLAFVERQREGLPPALPRRIAYVVNRRTIVDQATNEALRLRKNLMEREEFAAERELLATLCADPSGPPIAISTLRGQFADNGEWRDDPARPAIVLGTIDMIGSRLLFSGYGRGFRSRPLHAGLLGQDTLVVHDEAHLEPAFQSLLDSIGAEQERRGDLRPLRWLALSATSRDEAEAFRLTPADLKHPTVLERLHASKSIRFHAVENAKSIAPRIADLVLPRRDSNCAVLVYARTVEDVEKIAKSLRDAGLAVQTLTGTMRGFERDALTKSDPIFARFLRREKAEARGGTVVLVATSAGEVGVDLSADHLVCDLTPFDSMAQRFGRVNRFGEGRAEIDIVHSAELERLLETKVSIDSQGEDSGEEGKAATVPVREYERAAASTLGLLRRLPPAGSVALDGSPGALASLPAQERLAAFTPTPIVLPVTEILFDGWALTSARGAIPGRPPVTAWLRGVVDWEPPETSIAWREEVELLDPAALARFDPDELLEDFPIKPHEILRDRSSRVAEHLAGIARRAPDLPVWLVDADRKVERLSFADLVPDRSSRDKFDPRIAFATVVLPPCAGGLRDGMLDHGATRSDDIAYDVSCELNLPDHRPARRRVWGDATVPGMRRVRTIDLLTEDGDADRFWHWYVSVRSSDDDASRSAGEEQSLQVHAARAEAAAASIAKRLGLDGSLTRSVGLAARWHDLGKGRAVWQRSIGNDRYPDVVLAKSGSYGRMLDLGSYRHEFGSLLDLAGRPEFDSLDQESRDLVAHLVAAHHGRARPHFPAGEGFDPNRPETASMEQAMEVPRRFARLQRRYGRWGLAFLESLVRCADVMASRPAKGADEHGISATAEESR